MDDEKNLMSAISGLSDAKPDPEKGTSAKAKPKPKVIKVGKGGSFTVKKSAEQHPHRNLGKYLHPAKK